jgi:DNA-binding transcriptional ArsR family regulator
LSQPTISHHLKVLTEAGLLQRDKRGVWAYYRLAPGALAAVGALFSAPVPARWRHEQRGSAGDRSAVALVRLLRR